MTTDDKEDLTVESLERALAMAKAIPGAIIVPTHAYIYETVEVPFVTMGNRQVLTDAQLAESPELFDFVQRFKNCFKRDAQACVWIYSPAETEK